MPYITKQDMIDRFTERRLARLTDEVNDDVIHDDTINPAMEFADAKMDEYADRRYEVPIISLSASAIGHLCDIAMYRLHDDQIQDDSPGERTSWRIRYEEAIQWLTDISNGTIPLLDAEGKPVPVDEGETGGVAVVTRKQIYTAEVMSLY